CDRGVGGTDGIPPRAAEVSVEIQGKATRITLLDFTSPQMRAFHMSWIAFFLCFFAWFGIAPLMAMVREELQLTKDQVGWCIIASVSITILARLWIGWLCERYGPRLTYTWLLILGSLPVMLIGLSWNFESFLVFRLLIGAIGASFVITQFHTSVMFAPNCVGTANAAAAGWGNLGGGVTQMAMPLVFAFFVSVCGLSAAMGWRLAMVAAGIVCLLAGIAYWRFTQDAPEGNVSDLRAAGKLPSVAKSWSGFWEAFRDGRVWALFVIYGACFGIELTIDNIAHLYFVDKFGLSVTWAGVAAGLFGAMNIVARALGGLISDKCSARWGLRGRVGWLFVALAAEGILLACFSRAHVLLAAIPLLLAFGLFVKMSNGATYAVVPFVNRKALGAVSGIVGAGGNAGAVAAGFLFKGSLDWSTGLLILGIAVTVSSLLALTVKLIPHTQPAPEPAAMPELAPATE
ncbi:MAG TPA: MFS transporter, partial [Pirellulaceae bacterium]|nr:MFS transporter [Pirellulaceae bacterium]